MKLERHKEVVYLIVIVVMLLFSCSKKNNKTKENIPQVEVSSAKHSITNPIKQLVFGRFCAECGGECATMYKLDLLQNKLYADHTDSYWESRQGKQMRFLTNINNQVSLNLARQIIDSLPDRFLTNKYSGKEFGCADCTDGCGIYLEIENHQGVHPFVIDYQTDMLSDRVRPYAIMIKRVIEKLEADSR